MFNRIFGFVVGILSVIGGLFIYLLGIRTGKIIYKEDTKSISYRRMRMKSYKEEEES